MNDTDTPARESTPAIPVPQKYALSGLLLPLSRHLSRDPELSLATYRILMNLLLRLDSDAVCWPSRRRIAEDTGISERQVTRSVRELMDRGWLTAERRYEAGQATLYRLDLAGMLAHYEGAPEGLSPGGRPDVSQPGGPDDAPPATPGPPEEIPVEDTQVKKTPPAPRARAREGESENEGAESDAVKTLLLMVRREGDPVLSAEYRLLVREFGAEAVIETAALLSAARDPKGRRTYPWPSVLLDHLPGGEEVRQRLRPAPAARGPSGRRPRPGHDALILPASEVARRDREAAEATLRAALADLVAEGLDAEVAERYAAAYVAGDGATLAELDPILDQFLGGER